MAKLKVTKKQPVVVGGGGGEGDPPASKSLTYPQINLWSDFVDSNPNIKGMDSMWEAFSKKYPKHGIDRTVLTSDLDRLIKVVQDRADAWGEKSPNNLTTGMSFPKVFYEDTPYGRMNAYGKTELAVPSTNQAYPAKLVKNKIPDDVTDFWYDQEKALWAYDDPHEGVIKYAAKPAGYTEKMAEKAKQVYLTTKKENK